MEFNKVEFDKAFPKAIETLAKSEKVTKETLRELSRNVLAAFHQTEDVAYLNKVVNVLTPVNRKVVTMFFAEFSGFRQTDGVFTKKDKVNYAAAVQATAEFLEDPLNNVWTWAEREISVEKKEFDISQVTKAMDRFVKKAGEAHIDQADVLRAVFKAGFSVEALLAVMSEIQVLPKQPA